MLKPGEKKGIAREVSFYVDRKKNKPMVAVKLESLEPEQGEIIYTGILEGKNASFTGRDLRAMGWESDSLDDAKAQIEGAAAVISFAVEMQTYTKNNGDQGEFAVVRRIGSSAMPVHSSAAIAMAAAGAAEIAEYEKKFGKYPTPSPSDDVPF